MSVDKKAFDAPEQSDLFALLPDELIIKVFSFLDSTDLGRGVPLVSHRFHDLCVDPSLWTRLSLPPDCDHGKALRLLQRCTMLTEFHVPPARNREDDSGLFLAILALKNCPTLRMLALTDMTTQVQEAIREHGHSLISLCVYGIRFCGCIVERNPKLGSLITIDMGCNLVEDSFLRKITDHCHGLENFSCEENDLTDSAVTYFLEAVSCSIKTFSFSGTRPMTSLLNISKCLLLKELTLRGKVTNVALLVSATMLPKLTHLGLWYTYDHLKKSDFLLTFSNGKLTGLTSLDLICNSAVDDDVLRRIADNCPNLGCLNLTGCDKVTEFGIIYAWHVCKRLYRLQHELTAGCTTGASLMET